MEDHKATLAAELEAQRVEHARIRAALDAQTDTFFLFDPTHEKALLWNEAFTRLTGYTDAEVAALPAPASYYSAEDLARAAPFVEEVMRVGQGTIELDLVCKDGRRVPTEYRVSVIPDDQGQPRHLISIGRDIGERRQAEAALRRSEERYRLVFESMRSGFALHEIVLDEQGEPVDYVFLELNPAFEAITGLRRDQVVGRRVTDVLPGIEDDPADWIGRYGRVALGRGEVRFTQHSASLDAVFAVQAFSPQPGRFVTVFEDITERIRSQERIRQLSEIVEQSPQAIVLTDLDFGITYLNPAAQRMYGWELDEIRGQTPDLFNAEPLSEEIQRGIYEAVSAGRTYEAEVLNRHRDGRRFHNRFTVAPILDAEGRPEAFMSTGRDVSAEVLSRVELAASEAKYRLLFDHAGVLVSVYDRQGVCQLMNRFVAQLFGGQPQDFVGRSFHELHPELGPEYVRRIQAAIDSGQTHTYEDEVRFAEGARWLRSEVTPFPDPQGEPRFAQVISVDLTEQRRMEQQVAQADRLAAMGMLAAGVAHEVNNPLSWVLYNLESLVQELDSGSLDSDQLTRLQQALDGARRIHSISRALGSFSRVEEDRLEEVDLREVVRSATRMAGNELRFRARVHLDLAEVPVVQASEGRLFQVFLNLLVNAVHAIEEGDVEGNAIRVRTWAEAGEVCVEVQDSGSGIPPEHLEQLFEPFFTTKAAGYGSGLGLAISRSIVEGYGGSIQVRSKVGEGSRFLVRLPVAQGLGVAERSQVSATAPAEDTPGRLLIVDDEPGVRQVLGRILRQNQTVLATGGADAQAILAQDTSFDLILCDLMMPEVSGMELHAWLEQRHPRLARSLIFLTGGAFTPAAQGYLERAGNLTLEKPLNVAELRRVVAEHLRTARGRGSPAR